MIASGWPGWAAISATGIERLILPPSPVASQVLIGADHDESSTGERAARAAAARWVAEGRRVRIALPPDVGSDWSDVLCGAAANEMGARHAA
jgi:putative DNA primase/helicase